MTEGIAKEIISVNLIDEMSQSYLDYAMSVIIGRALPDVRDGLKPVHRRSLYAMHVLNNDWNKAYKKSARIVGDVIGKYHPHGDTAVYDTIVRLAQPFSMRHPLVDGQGNFGSVDGDAPAAMRYTEIRMSKLAHELLADIDKDTVDFIPNYDGSEHEPAVLPARTPNLLINGSSGIAVGMATNIPPHNLEETINAVLAVLDNPTIEIDDLMAYLPAPDFPTAGLICGRQGVRQAYHTGRGRVVMRARAHIEEGGKSSRDKIIATELPYMVNKARLLERIAELVKDKKLTSIAELRDESDKDGIRVVVELKRGEVGEVVLNNLYQHTSLQSSFSINMVVLIEGRPILANLKQVLEAFIRHRRDVIIRRTIFELHKAKGKAHILEGQAIALVNIDEVITLIKAAATPAEAKQALMSKPWKPGMVLAMLEKAKPDDQKDISNIAVTRPDGLEEEFGVRDDGYHLSAVQAQAILDLRLHRLTGLEQNKIVADYQELVMQIIELLEILSNPDKLTTVIRDELTAIKEEYKNPRRSEIIEQDIDISMEDLISEEDVVVTFSRAGYIKYQALDVYHAQHRGGRGKTAASVREEDFIDKLFIANTHDTLLCFSSAGQVYWLKVYRLPSVGRIASGKPIVNFLPLRENERITAILPIKDYSENANIVMATEKGVIKKTALHNFSRPRSNGIRAISLKPDDQLIGVELTDGQHDIMLFSNGGKAVRFQENELRSIGRTAAGVRGIRLKPDNKVISLLSFNPDEETGNILIATQNGYGKRTHIDQFSMRKRGGIGVISIQTSERNGQAVSAVITQDQDQLMLITTGGTLIRTKVAGISQVGRNAQGVRLIKLRGQEQLAEVALIATLNNIDDQMADTDASEPEPD